ncbi:hypothetical protein SK128_011853, partial [Halocaridina rubra]
YISGSDLLEGSEMLRQSYIPPVDLYYASTGPSYRNVNLAEFRMALEECPPPDINGHED